MAGMVNERLRAGKQIHFLAHLHACEAVGLQTTNQAPDDKDSRISLRKVL